MSWSWQRPARFLLLKEAGEKYDVNGRPRWPEDRAYMRYLNQLE